MSRTRAVILPALTSLMLVLPTLAAQASEPAATKRAPASSEGHTLKSSQLARPAEFEQCLGRLKPQAAARGVSASSFESLTARLAPDLSVIALLDAQPEFVTPLWDYLAALVDDERVADGRAMLERWREVLGRVEARFAVEAETVVAVWGVESDFGRRFGKRPLLESLSTLSCYGRRQTFFQGEFFSAMKIVQDGDVPADKLVGSWAGAFGHTQFMPSTYIRLAVDFDGDGRRDLVDSVPDALGSSANFLARAGWRAGLPWGFEVRLPDGFDASGAGRRNRQPVSAWAARGVRRIDGGALAAGALATDTPAAILLPTGARGPAFLVTRNFDALFSYNAAESYALAIAHLSDRLRGGGPFVTPWPTDDPGLSRAERRELQRLLIARGHDIGEADGMIGQRTREALKAELALRGMASDGRAGKKALQALQSAR